MSALEELQAAISAWDRRRLELAQLSIRRDGDWRKQTVQYRRLIQADITRIATALAALEPEPRVEQMTRELRGALSALRTCVAEHQANWPVVGIDPDDPGYERSVMNLRAVSGEFVGTSQGIVERMARSLAA